MMSYRNENIISESSDFILLRSCSDEMEFSIVAGLLESNGIEVKGKKIELGIIPSSVYRGYSGKSVKYDLYVKEIDFEEAKELLEVMQKDSAEEFEEDSYERIEEEQFEQQAVQTEKRQSPMKRLSLLIFAIALSYLAFHNDKFREIPLEIVIGIIFIIVVIIILKGRRDQVQDLTKNQ
ncbi:MAG: DUF2007 domain-containing protein [Deltaproteobacteria bacterium]|nr:MAG: DUF2007 domain-containing protein [Deltaproteobacteria bacterium]